MGKSEKSDAKKAEKKARKRAKKEEAKKKKASKEAKKIKKEKRKEKKSKHHHHKDSAEKQDSDHQQDSSGIISTYLANLPQQSDHDLDRNVFQRRKMEILVSVLPAALANITESLEETVRQMLLKYHTNVGVLIAFENLKRLGNNGNGRILNELPHLHYNVGFDALVFAPKQGSKLQGTITDSFPSHLGLLVIDYVNVMIPAEKLQQAGFGYYFGEWALEDGTKSFSKGNSINFVVERIHECAGTISLEGRPF